MAKILNWLAWSAITLVAVSLAIRADLDTLVIVLIIVSGAVLAGTSEAVDG